MPRKTKKETLTKRNDPASPWLFDEDDLPIRNDVVKAVQENRYQHTGARLLDDEDKAFRVVELLMAGWGLKKIAQTVHISKHSVKAARKLLEAEGKLAPWKERVLDEWEEALELGAKRYRRALENDEIPPAQIPVGNGIIFDKRALALGEPTSIVGKTSQDEKLTVDALNGWLETLPKVEAALALPPTSDSQSSVTDEKPQ